MSNQNMGDWVVGRDRELTRGLSSESKNFENLFFSEAEDQGQKQKIGDWVGVFEKTILGIRISGSDIIENRISGTGWVVGRED